MRITLNRFWTETSETSETRVKQTETKNEAISK